MNKIDFKLKINLSNFTLRSESNFSQGINYIWGRSGEGKSTLLNSIRLPLSGWYTPVIKLKNVDFPDPLGPIRPWTVFSFTDKDTLFIAWRPPKLLQRLRVSSRATCPLLTFADKAPIALKIFYPATDSARHVHHQKYHWQAKHEWLDHNRSIHKIEN